MRMHEDVLDVDAEVVRHLVTDQFPEWSALPIVQVEPAGSVNAIFRVGDSLVARFPLHAWWRGMAWALQQAMGVAWYYADTNPVMSMWGLRTLQRVATSSAAKARRARDSKGDRRPQQ